MAEREPFDQLAELPGEPPRPDFAAELESRLRAVRTDVGPATPTDHEIEGVVPMPEATPDEPRSKRLPLIAVAAAAIAIVIAVVALGGGEDEGSNATDVVTETEDDEQPPPTEDSDGSSVADEPTPEPSDADEPSPEPTTQLEVAQAWMEAAATLDKEAFQALHREDAIVRGSVFAPAGPNGSLDNAFTAERYWGGFDAWVANAERWGIDENGGSCVDETSGLTCTFTDGLFGPGTTPLVVSEYALQVENGLVSDVVVTVDFLTLDGELFFDQFVWDQQLYENEIVPTYAACLAIEWNRADCGRQLGDHWIDAISAMAPELLDLPDS